MALVNHQQYECCSSKRPILLLLWSNKTISRPIDPRTLLSKMIRCRDGASLRHLYAFVNAGSSNCFGLNISNALSHGGSVDGTARPTSRRIRFVYLSSGRLYTNSTRPIPRITTIGESDSSIIRVVRSKANPIRPIRESAPKTSPPACVCVQCGARRRAPNKYSVAIWRPISSGATLRRLNPLVWQGL
jgi:hypothetical protein